MNKQYLPESKMLPKLRLARLYDTREAQVFHPTQIRIATSYELSVFLDNGGILTANGISYPIHRGDVRFACPGDRLCSVPPYRSYSIAFRLGEEPVLYYNELLNAIPPYFSGQSHKISFFQQIIQLFSVDEPGSRVRQNALLLQLLANLYQAAASDRQYSVAVQKSVDHMKEHLSEKITLEQLGALAGYSPLHLLRLFRTETQLTPHEYLSALRMTRAKEMLRQSDASLGQIAAICGFSSESYFCTLFKRVNQITPGKWRDVCDHRLSSTDSNGFLETN